MTTDKPTGAVAAGLSAPALGGIFEAVSGLRNRRAIVALLSCLVGGVLLGGLLLFAASIAGSLFSLLAFLIYAVAVAVGVNAAGLLQMDEARGVPPRPLADALAGGLVCLPKLIVLGLAMFAVSVGVMLVVALLLLLCKIPFLGPLLYVVVFPVSVVVSGFTLWATMLCLALSLPAIWQGASLGQALTQTLAIARGRLVEGLLLLLALGVLCFGVSLVVFGVLGVGLGPTLALSASLLGIGGGGGMTSMLGGAGGGIAVAGLIGGSLLWAVAVSLVGQVYLRGLSIVYIRLTQGGLDVASAGAAWRSGVDAVRGRSAAPEHDGADRAPSAPPVKAAAATAAAASAAVTAEPPASFEEMQSAAFGGAPLSPAARNETSLPRPLSPRPPPAAAPDIDLGFDATAPGLDLSPESGRTSDLDLPLTSPAPASVDLLFDDTVTPAPPAPPPSAPAVSSVTSVDLAFDDLVAAAPVPAPATPAEPEIDEVTRIGAAVSGSPAAAPPPVRAPEQLFVAPAPVPAQPPTQPFVQPFVLAPAPPLAQPPAQPLAPPPSQSPGQPPSQPLMPPPATPPVSPPAARPSYSAPPAWTPPPTAAATPPVPKPPPLLTACPQCLAAVASNDVFCGVCGYRLK